MSPVCPSAQDSFRSCVISTNVSESIDVLFKRTANKNHFIIIMIPCVVRELCYGKALT